MFRMPQPSSWTRALCTGALARLSCSLGLACLAGGCLGGGAPGEMQDASEGERSDTDLLGQGRRSPMSTPGTLTPGMPGFDPAPGDPAGQDRLDREPPPDEPMPTADNPGAESDSDPTAVPAPDAPETPASLQDEVQRLFPFSPDAPLEVYFACQRLGLEFVYDYEFLGDGTLLVRLVTDTGDELSLPGTYRFADGVIAIDPIADFTQFAETSREVVTALGMVVGFTTQVSDPGFGSDAVQMQCVALGHGYNDPATESYRHYRCEPQRFEGLDYDNAIEFTGYASRHAQLLVPGSVFRHREWLGATGNILRGYGIYRRAGDTYYAYFGQQFDDANLLKGEFEDGDRQISVPVLGIDCGL